MIELLVHRINIFVVPPLLSLILGWSLAIMSVMKGKFRTENVLFSLVCIWWTLMSPIFISHQLLRGDIGTIMKIERSIHFVYVYLPVINLLFLEKAFHLKNRPLLILTIIVSALTSMTTLTGHYFSGLYEYSWGYSGRGEIAFRIWGTYGFFIICYILYVFVRKLKSTKNLTERLKIEYIALSFVATGLLTLLNIPAIMGIDFYAFGNFMFIPLSLLAYGVLRYRLMDIRSVLHITLIWGIISSLIIVPNVLIFYYFEPEAASLEKPLLFAVIMLWFTGNYLYLKKIQPVIDRQFNRRKYDLLKLEIGFIDTISNLRTLDDLMFECTDVVIKALSPKSLSFYVRKEKGRAFVDRHGSVFDIQDPADTWLSVMDHIVEYDMAVANPTYDSIRSDLMELFNLHGSRYIVPMVRNTDLMGILFLSERHDLRQLNSNEILFLNRIRSSVSISIANSIMYQDLNDLKDTLESKVESRTEELLRTMEEVERMNNKLVSANRELEQARKIAEFDMTMAAHVQKSIFPLTAPQTDQWDIAFEFRPMSGVSGDLYDFYLEGEKLRGMSIMDVAGHGIASGLITMIARSSMHRNFSRFRNEKLAKVIAEVNRELIEEISGSNKFISGILLRFEGDTVEYINAGHPDLIIKKKSSGRALQINPSQSDHKGVFLGLNDPQSSYRAVKFKIDRGDALVMFTDCLIEGLNGEKTPYGMNGVAESCTRAASDSASQILETLLNDFNHFTGGKKLNDDLTVIVARKK